MSFFKRKKIKKEKEQRDNLEYFKSSPAEPKHSSHDFAENLARKDQDQLDGNAIKQYPSRRRLIISSLFKRSGRKLHAAQKKRKYSKQGGQRTSLFARRRMAHSGTSDRSVAKSARSNRVVYI